MKTKINDSNIEVADDLIRLIRRRKLDIKNLEEAMSTRMSSKALSSVRITLDGGMSYATPVEILADNMGEFVAPLIPADIGDLQADIDNCNKKLDNL